MKKPCISMMLQKGTLEVAGRKVNPKLPPGCLGILFVFESKKAAREFGSAYPLQEISLGKEVGDAKRED